MSLRVTQGIIYSNALQNIRRATSQSLEASNQVATGRRVSKPSDDPAAILRIMPLQAEIRDLQQTQGLLASSQLVLNNATAMLEGASSTMASLREETVRAANGTLTAQDRSGILSQVDELLQQMLASANGKWGDRFLFGGSRTDAPPFGIVDDGGGARVTYRGDQNTTSIQVAAGITTEVNAPGDRIFLARSRQATQFSGNTGAAPSGAADSGVGFGSLEVTFAGLGIPGGTTGLAQGDGSTTALGDIDYVFTAGAPPTLSLDGGPPQQIVGGIQSFTVGTGSETVSLDVTTPISPASGTIVSQANLSADGGQSTWLVDDFSGVQSYQVRNSFDGTVVNVNVSALARTGAERVKFEGTFDPFTTLIEIREILRNEEGVPDSEVASRLSEMLPDVDSAHNSILSGLQQLGNRSSSLQLFESRLGELEVSRKSSLSDLEDVDFAEAIIRLNQQELSFQASLQISARAVQTTLLNFLR